MDRNRSAFSALASFVRASRGTEASSDRVMTTVDLIRSSINWERRLATSSETSFSFSPLGPIVPVSCPPCPGIYDDFRQLQPEHPRQRTVAAAVALGRLSQPDRHLVRQRAERSCLGGGSPPPRPRSSFSPPRGLPQAVSPPCRFARSTADSTSRQYRPATVVAAGVSCGSKLSVGGSGAPLRTSIISRTGFCQPRSGNLHVSRQVEHHPRDGRPMLSQADPFFTRPSFTGIMLIRSSVTFLIFSSFTSSVQPNRS